MAYRVDKVAARKAARKVVRMTSRATTASEGRAAVKRLTGAHSAANYRQVAKAAKRTLPPKAAAKLISNARVLKVSTGGHGSLAARKAAKKTARKLSS